MTRTAGILTALALGGLLAFGLGGATQAEDKAAATTAPYVHVVIFYLNKDAPAGQAKAMISDARTLLGKIPSVRSIRAGTPAEMSTPDVAQKGYDVGLLVLFDDAAGLKNYLVHPLHLQYVERHLKHIQQDKLLVFDFAQGKQ